MPVKVAVFVAFAVSLGPSQAAPQSQDQANLALGAKVSVSSSRPEYPLQWVNDGDMNSSWSTALGQVTGQWLQMDWDKPQTFACIVLYQTGNYVQSLEVQIEQGGKWQTVASSGSKERKAPLVMVIPFRSVTVRSLRLAIDGGAAFFEMQVYNDPAIISRLVAEHMVPRIVVSSDLRGHLIGTVSENSGQSGLEGAAIEVRGQTPNGPWSRTARADANGFFVSDLPFGTRGIVRVTAEKGDAHVAAELESADLSTALTPRPPRSGLTLNGTWEWAPDPPASYPEGGASLKWNSVKVPAHWEMEGLVAESGRAVYRRKFTIPEGWQGKRIKLRADAVYSHCEVWVNGKRAGSHEGGATPFELDATDAAKPGQSNQIEVLVQARSVASDLDNASVFAYFELAGIWQPIEVFAVEPAHISHLDVTTTYDQAYRNATLKLNLDLVNEQASGSPRQEVAFQLFDPRGLRIQIDGLKANADLGPWERKALTLSGTVKEPEPWNAEAPRVYKLVGYVDGKRVIEQTVGFRQIEVKDRALTLNGTPLKIRGISKLDAHPLMGRALTPEIDKLDTDLMKGANFNAVRATIFPPHPAALDCADKEGLYFENEGPTCWGGHADDLRYVPVYLGIMCEYLERDRNHPCVIDWSICNESDFARVFSITHQYLRKIDPTRTYTATYGDDSLDMATLHHPVRMDRIKESLSWPKPVFFDEVIGMFHGWEDLALWINLDPGMKDYWIEGLPEIIRAINAGHNQAGTIQFSWSDDAFLVPGKGVDIWRHTHPPIRYTESVYKLPKRGLVGDVAWGTVDGWRRPRPEYWLSKKLYSPVQIKEAPLGMPQPGQPLVVPVENFNQFVDLDRYVCKWSVGSEKGEARANCKPMSSGTLAVPVKHALKPDDVLALEFFDEKGRSVDAYRLTFKPHEIPVLPASGRPARLAEQGGYLDDARAVRLIGKDCELAYDRTSGVLLRALRGREVVMTAGPTLRLLKSNAPAETYPIGNGLELGVLGANAPTAWRLISATSRTENGQAVLDWKGNYGKDLVGGYQIRMDDDGDVEVGYEFTYGGPPITVREVALEFSVPLSCEHLEWDRHAEYSVYPETHLGRPHGVAIPHPKVPQTVPAGNRPYELDDHPWGCNDFRSTKRHIYWASLTNAEGEGIKVFSDGSQHIRATVGVHDILFKVMDYYGGEGWTYSGGYHYGEGKLIKTGDVLKGRVRLRLIGGEK